MIQYFQLTPEILLEYIYDGDPKLNDKNGKDIYDDHPTMLLDSKVFGSKYLCFKNVSEGLDSISNLVLPLNTSETNFVVAKNKYQNFYNINNVSNVRYSKNSVEYLYEDTNYDKIIKESGKSFDVKYDKCVVHFTSRNYFENYDALVFQAYAYMKNKSKLYFASFIFRKTSNVELKTEHMLYNEKLYTTQIDFDIPSVFSILIDNKEISADLSYADLLKSQNIEFLKNTPIGINLYGVNRVTIETDNFEKLNTLKINSIHIPYIYNRLDEISVDIKESEDGDYYEIDPKISSKYNSFVDYIESNGEDIRAYVVMHELKLLESWVDNSGNPHSEITHKEQHIINIHEDDEDFEISRKFDAKIKYRPICMRGGLNYVATIIDTIKIINTIDSTSYEVTGSAVISAPHKYGKKLKMLGIKNEYRPMINVYNKKVSDKNGGNNTISLNRGGGFVVENHTQNITSFMESTNICVSVVELSPEDII